MFGEAILMSTSIKKHMTWVLIRIASPNWRGDSNEYPQHMVLWRTDEYYLLIIIKYLPYLFHCEDEQVHLSLCHSAMWYASISHRLACFTNLFLGSIKEIPRLFSLFLKFFYVFTHLWYRTMHYLPHIVTEKNRQDNYVFLLVENYSTSRLFHSFLAQSLQFMRLWMVSTIKRFTWSFAVEPQWLENVKGIKWMIFFHKKY